MANECSRMRVFTAKKFITRWFSIHVLLICIAPCFSKAVFDKILRKMQKKLRTNWPMIVKGSRGAMRVRWLLVTVWFMIFVFVFVSVFVFVFV